MTTTIPAPTIVLPKEEWPDADFDFPDGDPIHASDAESDKEEEDWDMEMDFGKTGGAKVQACLGTAGSKAFAKLSTSAQGGHVPRMHTIRPPLQSSGIDEEDEDED